VEANVEGDGEGVLISARCDGDRDQPTYQAAMMVSRYLNLLGTHAYDRAYQLLSPTGKGSRSFAEFVEDAAKFDLSLYNTHEAGTCLEIAKRISASSVQIRAGVECYIRYAGRPCTPLTFDVQRKDASGHWEISAIERAPY
jgi:hypothetical protein